MVFMFGVVRWLKSLADERESVCVLIYGPSTLESWEKAKTMTECYDYLFEIAVKMKSIGIDPAVKPASEPDYE